MDFWDIVIPALAGGILGPIYARWFRWWKRSRVLWWPRIILQEWNLLGQTSG